jgi:muconate cycloisomerase
MENKIERIELTPIHVPFRNMVQETMSSGEGGLGMAIPSEESWTGADFVICKLFTNTDFCGLAESYVWLPETGVSPTQIIDSIKNSIAKYVLGENPFDIEKINYRMDINISRNEVAKGLLDMACYDLMGKIANLPVYQLLGGKSVKKVPCAALIPLTTVEEMIKLTEVFIAAGYKSLRIKLGKSIEDDIKIIGQIRESVGPKVRLRVDYNQAYDPSTAVRAIRAIEHFNIDIAEQPVKISDFLGMAYVQNKVTIPLMAHESFFSETDFVNLVEMKAVRALGLNTERPGGITKAIRCLNYAQLRGLSTVLHNQPLGIGTAALVHLATAKYYSLGHAIEIFGDIMLEDDLILKRIPQTRGFVKAPKGPGWGVEIDQKSMDKYTTEPITIIKL